jgi:hypothetical protein
MALFCGPFRSGTVISVTVRFGNISIHCFLSLSLPPSLALSLSITLYLSLSPSPSLSLSFQFNSKGFIGMGNMFTLPKKVK